MRDVTDWLSRFAFRRRESRTVSHSTSTLTLEQLEPRELLSAPVGGSGDPGTAKYVILMIGDGMGFEHVRAARSFNGSPLSFEGLSHVTDMTTFAANSSITDSAASATAMATGRKVNNGVISMEIPGESSELETALEVFQAQGRRVGLVTTTYLTHATPAAFGAHEPSRNNTSQIANDYLTQTRPNVLFGGGSNGMTVSAATAAGYTVVTDRTSLQGLDTETATFVSGHFGSGHLPYEYDGSYATLPHLSEMTESALAILDNDTTNGFFLLVESGRIDHAGHANQIERNIHETLEFGNTVQEVIDWINDTNNDSCWANTLLLVTADHETGGLAVVQENGAGNYPTVTWSTGGHTGVNVPVHAQGVGADLFTTATIDNTDIRDILLGEFGPTDGVVDVQVNQSSDDAEERVSDGGMYLDSSDIELITDPGSAGAQTVGLRFQNITIPQGATITSAYLEFETDETSSGTTQITIRGQDADSTETFTTATNNISDRPTTTAGVNWSIPAWNTVSEKHQSPSLSAVVQEVVDRAGWTSGNSMVFIITGTGSRTAESFDGEASNAPRLYIEYATGPINTPPTAVDDPTTTTEDTAVMISPLGNDTDPDDDTLSITGFSQSGNGLVSEDAHAVLTYLPNPNYHGMDSFTYTIEDGNGGTDTATVTITVSPVNDAPRAADDVGTTTEDSAITINVRINDQDIDGDPLTVSSVGDPANGSTEITPEGTIRYTPDPDYYGMDSFTYTIDDGNGGTDTAIVSVTVAPVNDPPTADNDSTTTGENSAITLEVRTNDQDIDGDMLTVTSVSEPINGSAELTPEGTIQYTPNPDFHGMDSFMYTIDDGNGGTDTATVTITVTPVNDVPTASDDATSTAEDSVLTIDVLVNDQDIDGDTLTVMGVGDPSNGSTEITPEGTIWYTPNPNYHGMDSFTYTIEDGNGGTDTAIVSVTVTAVNDAPTANEDTVTTAEDSAVVINVLINDEDVDGDVLAVVNVTDPPNGSAEVTPEGTIRYTPSPDFHGEDSFTYAIQDGNGGMDTATVSITVTSLNDLPTATSDTLTMTRDGGTTSIDVLDNDADVDGDSLVITDIDLDGTVGAVVINGTLVDYTPLGGFIGSDTFAYSISDGNGGTASATVTVTVNELPNNPPIAQSDSMSALQGMGVTIDVLSNDMDPEGDPLRIRSVTTPSHGSVEILPDGRSLRYVSEADYTGSDIFLYTLTDDRGGTAIAAVEINVNSPPTVPPTPPPPPTVPSPLPPIVPPSPPIVPPPPVVPPVVPPVPPVTPPTVPDVPPLLPVDPPVDQNEVTRVAVTSGSDGGVAFLFNQQGRIDGATITIPGSFPGGLRPSHADVTGDGRPDTIVGTGPGVSSAVFLFDGITGSLIRRIEPFEPSFLGGVFVAAGDFNADGHADVVVTPDQGGGPRVRVFSGRDGTPLADFFGIDDSAFRGGARPAVGDLNGDGATDLLVAAGFGGGPRLAVFNGRAVLSELPWKLFPDFFVFEPTLRNGTFVTSGDLNGDGTDDLIVGSGPGGAPRVFALSGADLMVGIQTQLANFFGGDPTSRGGLRVTAKQLDGDDRADLVIGIGSGSRVTAYAGTDIAPDGTPPELFSEEVIPGAIGGVFVG